MKTKSIVFCLEKKNRERERDGKVHHRDGFIVDEDDGLSRFSFGDVRELRIVGEILASFVIPFEW